MGKRRNNLNNFAIQCFNSINEIKFIQTNFFLLFRNYRLDIIAKKCINMERYQNLSLNLF